MSQRRTVQGAFGNSRQGLFEEYATARQDAAKQRTQERVLRRQRAIDFRHRQVALARTYDAYTRLPEESLAHRVATKMFNLFACIDVPRGSSQNRTERAFQGALVALGLTHANDCRSSAVKHGKTIARAALKWAYTEVTSQVEMPGNEFVDA